MTEVESRQKWHVADDEAEGGISDVQAGQPKISHVPELAAIVLTCGNMRDFTHLFQLEES